LLTAEAARVSLQTTNPSLLASASKLEQYRPLVDDAISYARRRATDLTRQTELAMDKMAVNFGTQILSIVPGRVSTEVDARLSFNTEASLRKARELIALYKEAGIDRVRPLLSALPLHLRWLLMTVGGFVCFLL
jgi:transaldolase